MTKICINCGSPVLNKNGQEGKLFDENLYKKSKILKLLPCEKCGNICDKYVEYEGTLILLDLSLQNKEAYRHVLFNENHTPTILKMSLLTLIVEGYCRWATNHTGGQFFEQEFQFYTNVGESLASLIVYLLVSLVIILNKSMVRTSVSTLLVGLLLAYCTRFLKLAALLWVTTDTAFLWSFVDFFFLITSINVVQVLTGQSKHGCAIAMSMAHLALQVNDRSSFVLESNPVPCL